MANMKLLLLFFFYLTVAINGQEEKQYIPNYGYNYYRGPKRPHILFFMGDDIGWNDVGWNNERIHTPYMDSLAKSGVILDYYYTFTLCTPSRASMMTGYYSDRLGLQRGVLMPTQPYGLPLRFKILPDLLKEVGYDSYVVGKWHLGYCSHAYTPLMRGVSGFMGFYNGGEENYEHCLGYLMNRTANGDCYGFDYRIDNDLAHEYDGKYSGTVFANYAVDVLDEHDPEDPIFMYIALTDPHFPLQPPEEHLNNCQNSVNKARKTFCGAMSAMDAAVEAIVTKLKEKGMYDNSVIIFASDNGGSAHFGGNNYPLRGEKTTIYEGGARVPAFVHSPLLRKRRYVNTELIHVSDWYPTIAYLAGAVPAYDLDGLNQWNTISRSERSPRTELPYLLDSTDDGTQMAAVRSRAALLTGYYSDRLGLQRGVLWDTQPYGIPLKFNLLPQKLGNLGYNSVAVGKWHLGYCSWSYTPLMRGFRSWVGFFTGAEENYRHCANYYRPNLTDGSCVGLDFTDGVEVGHHYKGQYSGAIYTQRMVTIIRNYKPTDQPIFAYVSLTDSHWPLQAPTRFAEKCKNSVNSARENMCAGMASMDEGVQNITEALKEVGIYNNSIIIFVSDNGGSVRFGGNNYPLRGDKGTLYEGACRVPAFVHSKLLKKTGYRNKELFHIVDWYPTLLHLAGGGQDIDKNLDGYNQWNMIENGGKSLRHSLPYSLDISDDGIYMAAVRNERYKLIAGPGGFRELVHENETVDESFDYDSLKKYTTPGTFSIDLKDTEYKVFDLIDDPSESRNLSKERPELREYLKKLLIWYRRRSRPAMSILTSENGKPEKHNNSYVPGWCNPYFEAPQKAIVGTDQMTFQLH